MNKFLLILSILFIVPNIKRQNNSENNIEKIRDISCKICQYSTIPDGLLGSLLNLFEVNEKMKDSNKSFPQLDSDNKLFYCLIDKIGKEAKKNYKCILFMIKLSFVIKSNIEEGEYVSRLIPYLAIENTSGFLKSFSKLDKYQKETTIYNLSFLNEINKMNILYNNFSKLQNKELYAKEIIEIRNALSD